MNTKPKTHELTTEQLGIDVSTKIEEVERTGKEKYRELSGGMFKVANCDLKLGRHQ